MNPIVTNYTVQQDLPTYTNPETGQKVPYDQVSICCLFKSKLNDGVLLEFWDASGNQVVSSEFANQLTSAENMTTPAEASNVSINNGKGINESTDPYWLTFNIPATATQFYLNFSSPNGNFVGLKPFGPINYGTPSAKFGPQVTLLGYTGEDGSAKGGSSEYDYLDATIFMWFGKKLDPS